MATLEIGKHKFEYNIVPNMFKVNFMGQNIGFENYEKMQNFLVDYVKSIHHYEENEDLIPNIDKGVEAE